MSEVELNSKNMKSYIYAIIIVLAVLLITTWVIFSDAKIAKDIKEANKPLPMLIK